jgi:transposase InsO family protein
VNALTERWVQTCRRELLDRALIWNQHHLLRALREFEDFYNEYRPHRSLNGAPLRPAPEPLAEPSQLEQRIDRLGGYGSSTIDGLAEFRQQAALVLRGR